MLQSIRDKLSGWITWFIVIVIILIFALFGLGYYFQGMASQPNVVAKVNGQPIYAQQLALVYRNLRQQVGGQALNPMTQTFLRQQALSGLIDQLLIQQSAKALGLGVSEAQVDTLITQMPAFQENGKFSPQRFNMAIQSAGMDIDNVRAQLKATLLSNQLQSAFVQSEVALPGEVQQFNRLMHQKRSIAYLLFPIEEYKKKIQVSDQAVAAYYQAHTHQYYSKPKVKIAYIALSLPKLKQQQHLSQSKAEDLYYKKGRKLADPTFHHY